VRLKQEFSLQDGRLQGLTTKRTVEIIWVYSEGYDLFAPKSSIWAGDFDGSDTEFEGQAEDGTNSVGSDRAVIV